VPGQQLVAVHHATMVLPDGTPTGQQITQSAVLISQHAGTKKNNLHTILKTKPATLAQLDFTAFARTLIRVLLTNPEDDKGDDYFLVPLSGTDRYGLQRIDNERAFFPAEKLAPGARPSQPELLVKSVIYCLDWMQTPWDHPETRALLDDLRQLQPSALVTDIVEGLHALHPLWQSLFPETVVAQHALCQSPWISLPVLLVPEGLENILLSRLTSIQVALRTLKPSDIT